MLKRKGTTTIISAIWIHFTLYLETKAITKSRTVWLQIAASTLKAEVTYSLKIYLH